MEPTLIKLFSDAQIIQLMKNGLHGKFKTDQPPVAYLANYKTKDQYLLTALAPNNSQLAYGMLDIKGKGISIDEIDIGSLTNSVTQTFGTLAPECFITDEGQFVTDKPLSAYFDEAIKNGKFEIGGVLQQKLAQIWKFNPNDDQSFNNLVL